jgi:hypothetical protein
MQTSMKNIFAATSLASILALTGCGGGGDAGTSSSTNGTSGGSSGSSSQTVTGTLSTPQYASGSAQLAAFTLLNQYRTQCGFPAFQENTILDQAAQAHAQYQGLNNLVTDTEVQGNPGFTGVTGQDSAVHFGWPSGVYAGRGDTVYSTLTSSFATSQAGQNFIYAWMSGVYHASMVAFPANVVGVGEYETQLTDSNGYKWTQAWGTLELGQNPTYTLSNGTLTFPCQGVTGVPYKGVGESPVAPNVSTSGWGTPVVVMGNLSDTIVLQNASITGPAGSVTVQILNSTTDPNKQLGAYQAVAYPTSPLQPNTQYSVTLTGTINGTAFSRNFTFTTGNVVG